MARYKIIRTAELNALNERISAIESKGWYDSEGNDVNEYFRRIAAELKGVSLQAFGEIDRTRLKDCYEQMATVRGVIDHIADAVGEVFPYLELRHRKGDGWEYDDKHPVMEAIRHPNDRYNTIRFGKGWAVNRLVYDDAWVYAPKTKGARRELDAKVGMHIIPSWKVQVEKGGLLAPFRGIKVSGGGDYDTIVWEGNIFESFGYNLDDTDAFGSSRLVAAAQYLGMIDKGLEREVESLINGGPANIITPKADAMGVMAKDADNVEREFNGRNYNRTKALRVPVEVHQLGSKPIDLNILNSHDKAVNALCFVYHLPVDLYLGQAKYENAKEAKKTIYEQIAIPMAEEFGADLLNHLGLDRQGYEMRVNRDEIAVLQAGAADALDRLGKMHATLNEMREANGYDPIDEPYANQPMIPVGVQFGNEDYDINELG